MTLYDVTVAELCRIWIKAAPAAPLARRQRPGLWPWEAPPGRTPGHASQNAQIKTANE
jgi:hypothetical protein